MNLWLHCLEFLRKNKSVYLYNNLDPNGDYVHLQRIVFFKAQIVFNDWILELWNAHAYEIA